MSKRNQPSRGKSGASATFVPPGLSVTLFSAMNCNLGYVIARFFFIIILFIRKWILVVTQDEILSVKTVNETLILLN
jgi:hypothetical protein